MSKEKHLDNGWTWDRHAGAVVHFQHVPISGGVASEMVEGELWVVETINQTYSADRKHWHHNCYFETGLPAALALAAKLELTFQADGIAEKVIGVRSATFDEGMRYWAAYEVLTATEPPAYSDREVGVWAAKGARS